MNAYDLLRAAHTIIADESQWTQETMARDAKGAPCEPSYEHAKCFCTYGALARAAFDTAAPSRVQREAKTLLWRVAYKKLGAHGILDVNDNRDHAAVMEMFEHALAAPAEVS